MKKVKGPKPLASIPKIIIVQNYYCKKTYKYLQSLFFSLLQAVKLFTGGNYVELIPDEKGRVNININGRPVPSAIHGFAFPMQDTFYAFK